MHSPPLLCTDQMNMLRRSACAADNHWRATRPNNPRLSGSIRHGWSVVKCLVAGVVLHLLGDSHSQFAQALGLVLRPGMLKVT